MPSCSTHSLRRRVGHRWTRTGRCVMGAWPQTQSCPSQPCNKINIVTHRHKACYSKVNSVCACRRGKEDARLGERKRWSWGEGVISVSSMHQKPSKLSSCSWGVKISSFNILSRRSIATVAFPPTSEWGRGFSRSQALESCLTFPLTSLPLYSLALTSRKPWNNEHRFSKAGDSWETTAQSSANAFCLSILILCGTSLTLCPLLWPHKHTRNSPCWPGLPYRPVTKACEQTPATHSSAYSFIRPCGIT